MAQHLNAHANESRFNFCSNPPPEPKCTALAQNPLASKLANISPTVSKATPSPCKMRICCPLKRRNGFLPLPTFTLAWIFSKTLSNFSAYGSSFENTGFNSGRSDSKCSGRAVCKIVRSWGSVSIPSPESGLIRLNWYASNLFVSMALMESPPSTGTTSDGHNRATAFQMLKPSLTKETAKLGIYCLIMFLNALYSCFSYST
mmetsp:Transcript_98788/g.247616  ORF Transcript_98788/g.247616 Transcript_98788/m.247616 type:complete len:202 (+) Transcript_98788:718-1323(+)